MKSTVVSRTVEERTLLPAQLIQIQQLKHYLFGLTVKNGNMNLKHCICANFMLSVFPLIGVLWSTLFL